MSNAAETSSCPFCGRAVDSDIVAFGGQCPHCFGEIPGEEAPTDPGEEKRKAQEKAQKAQVLGSRKGPFAVLGLLLLTPVGIAAYILLQPGVEKKGLNLDDAAFNLGDVGEMVAYVEPTAAPNEVQPSVKGGPRPKADPGTRLSDLTGHKTTAVDFSGAGQNPTAPENGGIEGTRGTGPGDRNPGDMGDMKTSVNYGSSGSGPGAIVDAAIDVQRREHQGVTLTDDNAIVEMVKQVVGSELPKLRSCYDQRLKADETLQGAWLLTFKVTTAGKVVEAQAEAQDTSDPELEACMLKKVAQWPFQPIKEDLPITKTVRFRPR